MAFIHIKTESESMGRTRSEQAENFRKVYGDERSLGLTPEQIDKAKHLEKKLRDKHGAAPWLTGSMIDSVK